MDNRPIGVFDSGLGGLTAVREIMKILPNEDIVYFGDTGRVPYGSRSKQTITKYTRQDIRFLTKFDCKTVLVACGTASSVALPDIKNDYSFPIIGVVEGAAHRACQVTKNGKIGIIGTNATIKSGSYVRLISTRPEGFFTACAACPLFVPLVENARISIDDKILNLAIEEYLTPVKNAGVDTLILGCTHYPIIADAIGAFMGDNVTLVSPGLEAARILATMPSFTPCEEKEAKHRFFVSDDVDLFSEQASLFLGQSVQGDVGLINIEEM